MAKLPYRQKTSRGFPAARTPIDPLDPDTIAFDSDESLELNEGETKSNENRTPLVKQAHDEKFKHKSEG